MLLVFKLFVSSSNQLVYGIVSDILLLSTITFLFISLVGFFEQRKISPLSLIMNIGILSAFIFFLIFFYSSIISLLFENVTRARGSQVRRGFFMANDLAADDIPAPR